MIDLHFGALRVMGVVPVVAHPERNLVFAAEPGRLAALVERGAVAAVETLMKMGLVHLVASDVHSMLARPPRMAAARVRVRVRKAWGAEVGLFVANPRALLAGEELPWRG